MANPVRFIRRDVLGLTQAQLAAVLQVKQASVSRWETAGRFPADQQPKIREMGQQAAEDWSDSWFFEAPSRARTGAAA